MRASNQSRDRKGAAKTYRLRGAAGKKGKKMAASGSTKTKGLCKGVQVASPYLPGARATKPRVPAEDFKGKRIHFMGAGGIGVSAMMQLCSARGAVVSGCDCSLNGQAAALQARGIRVEHGHDSAHVADCDELVYTAAVEPSHPEITRALAEGKIASTRMHMLGRIMRGLRTICVTGSHGKTTTTWLIANLLITAGRDPSVLVGGVVKAMSGNVRIGRGAEFVAEVDESDNRLAEVVPSIPVLTNIDNDHLDHYHTVDAIEEAVTRFLASTDTTDSQAVLIGCGDDIRVRRSLQNASLKCRRAALAYGFAQHCDVIGMNLRREGLGWRFDALTPSGLLENIELPMPGEHNVLNALAAVSVAWHLNIPEICLRTALSKCERVGRRFEIKGTKNGVRVVDDYGHHPTEIAATLKAARGSTQGKLGVIFQPHRYTRTQQLLPQFATCFSAADCVWVMPIYAASEEPIPGVDHHALVAAIEKLSDAKAVAVSSRDEAIELAATWAREGDTLITQGAGDVTRAGDELVARL
ncbi:MAG TPA: UDP-N-acetylmuramate--L-alanine ligase [Planctomycetota bacterium]|jgi:UDP-N-acetylmuramate--alanine ligase